MTETDTETNTDTDKDTDTDRETGKETETVQGARVGETQISRTETELRELRQRLDAKTFTGEIDDNPELQNERTNYLRDKNSCLLQKLSNFLSFAL